MKYFLKRAVVLTMAFAALTGTFGAAPAAGEMAAKFKPGERAPDFTLRDLEGRELRLSSFAGSKVVLLAFWSLRCGACLQEVPYLERIHADYRSKGVAVISVVTDGTDASASKEIMKDIGVSMTYPVLLDPDFAVSDTYTNFVVPHTLVIDRTGVIRYLHTGFEKGTEKQYEAALAQALGS
jgi:peroxiredoxin